MKIWGKEVKYCAGCSYYRWGETNLVCNYQCANFGKSYNPWNEVHISCPFSKPITKEVVESFGFTQGLTWVNQHERYDKGEYCIQLIGDGNITIYKYMGTILFQGTINNPEELKFILTSLGIIE